MSRRSDHEQIRNERYRRQEQALGLGRRAATEAIPDDAPSSRQAMGRSMQEIFDEAVVFGQAQSLIAGDESALRQYQEESRWSERWHAPVRRAQEIFGEPQFRIHQESIWPEDVALGVRTIPLPWTPPNGPVTEEVANYADFMMDTFRYSFGQARRRGQQPSPELRLGDVVIMASQYGVEGVIYSDGGVSHQVMRSPGLSYSGVCEADVHEFIHSLQMQGHRRPESLILSYRDFAYLEWDLTKGRLPLGPRAGQIDPLSKERLIFEDQMDAALMAFAEGAA